MVGCPAIADRLQENLDVLRQRPTADANPRPTADGRSRPTIGSRVQSFASCHVNFTGEQRLSTGPQQVIKFITFNNYGYAWDKENKVWIPPSEEEVAGPQLGRVLKHKENHLNRPGEELAYRRASIDRQEVMLARLRQRFMPDQGSSGGGSTDLSP
ncbi:hypothetical protein M9H77_30589 [Catharanthus roseus]|uniref:Uncharacterized protein n=1 Tax=Catharanthus roseus TaxID=4058 RepID=A0ACC0A0A6_CATRO|nr:hypothetical protein M9H77_30589 [Catharanthus roseus]